MIPFRSYLVLQEAGVAVATFGYCPECSKQPGYKPQRMNPWDTKVQRCRYCGTGLVEKDGVKDTLGDSLKSEIEQMEKDPEVVKGQAIVAALQTKSPEEVYGHFGVDEKTADKLIEKAALLNIKKKKLARL